jgi:tetrahydromethanopterin S-methyltransferase subunit A
MSKGTEDKKAHALVLVREQLATATEASKCHGCGCLHKTVEALASTGAGRGALAPALERARAVFTPKEYDCLGCSVCYPALAANAFSEAFAGEAETMDLCPSDAPAERRGWPPLPGDYRVVRYRAPVAVCTLNSAGLADRIAGKQPEGVAIVGTLHTENLGIERIIRNVLANPHIRFLILCGEDTRQTVGHLPGQSLKSLFVGGVDARGWIIGARGKRPVLKNVRHDQVDAFRRQVEFVELTGVEEDSIVLEHVHASAARDPGAFTETPENATVEVVAAREPRRMVPDPAGFFVVYPDAPRRRLLVEHYTNAGVLDCVLEAATPNALYATAIERKLVSRLDHAAYLGRELARAQRAMETGEPYVQDRAPGAVEKDKAAIAACGCDTTCVSE